MKKKIYIIAVPLDSNLECMAGHYHGMALCEDGHGLGGWLSSSLPLAIADWRQCHVDFERHCPDGYDLEYIEDFENHAGYMEAWKLNQVQAAITTQTAD